MQAHELRVNRQAFYPLTLDALGFRPRRAPGCLGGSNCYFWGKSGFTMRLTRGCARPRRRGMSFADGGFIGFRFVATFLAGTFLIALLTHKYCSYSLQFVSNSHRLSRKTSLTISGFVPRENTERRPQLASLFAR